MDLDEFAAMPVDICVVYHGMARFCRPNWNNCLDPQPQFLPESVGKRQILDYSLPT